MAAVAVTSVRVLDNPAPFTNPLQFEIQYECMYHLKHDLEWKLTYVGSAESEKHDQVLDSVLVGPVAPGQYRFVFQADPPDVTKLPPGDVTGVTVLLLTCAYRGAEFLRVGYYVNTEYWDPALREDPPATVQIDKLSRSILADKPRVTRFPADFDDDGAGGAGGAVAAAVPGAAPAADAFDGGAAGFGAAPPSDDGAAAFAAAYGAPPPAPAFEGAAAVGGEGDVAMDG